MRNSALLLSLFALMSCAPKVESKGQSEPPKQQETKTVSAAPTTETGEASALEKLGITVFPEPQQLPPVVLKDLDGKTVSLADYKGKIVFFNFWATWCPPCRAEMPSIERMYSQLRGDDFDILAVSAGEKPETVRAFLEQNTYTFPIALDPSGEFSSIFAGRGIPTTYILDRRGRAIGGIIGGRSWDEQEVIAAFKDIMASEKGK